MATAVVAKVIPSEAAAGAVVAEPLDNGGYLVPEPTATRIREWAETEHNLGEMLGILRMLGYEARAEGDSIMSQANVTMGRIPEYATIMLWLRVPVSDQIAYETDPAALALMLQEQWKELAESERDAYLSKYA